MEYRNRKTGLSINYHELLEECSNVYIPPLPTAEYLNAVGDGYDIVLEVIPKNDAHVNVERDGIEEIDGQWFQKWKYTTWPEEQIQAAQSAENDRIQKQLKEDQAVMWSRIEDERARCKFGGVKVGDVWFHSDNDSRVQWLGLARKADRCIDAGNPPDNQLIVNNKACVWKKLGGGWEIVTAKLAIAVVEATEVLDSEAHAAGEMHKAAMLKLDNPLSYDFSEGWPDTYEVFMNKDAQ